MGRIDHIVHELSVAQQLLTILEETAKKEAVQAIRRVRLEVGALSCIDPDALAFCFSIAARGTVADGAQLDIATVPGEALCPACGARCEITDYAHPCPHCGTFGLNVLEGTEMILKDMEV